MAPCCSSKLLLLLLLFVYCWYTVTEGQIIVDCCLRVSEKELPRAVVKDYQRQIKGQGCSISATIFVTRKDKHLCAPVDRQWVNNMIKHVDRLKKKCMDMNYKGRRCVGLKPK